MEIGFPVICFSQYLLRMSLSSPYVPSVHILTLCYVVSLPAFVRGYIARQDIQPEVCLGHQEIASRFFPRYFALLQGEMLKEKRRNKGIDWEKWNRHNERRGCKTTAAYISAQLPLLRPLLLLLQVKRALSSLMTAVGLITQ